MQKTIMLLSIISVLFSSACKQSKLNTTTGQEIKSESIQSLNSNSGVLLMWTYLLFEDPDAGDFLKDKNIFEFYEITKDANNSKSFTWKLKKPNKDDHIYYKAYEKYPEDLPKKEFSKAKYALGVLSIGDDTNGDKKIDGTFNDLKSCEVNMRELNYSSTLVLYAYEDFDPREDVYMKHRKWNFPYLKKGFYFLEYKSKSDIKLLTSPSKIEFNFSQQPNLF